MDDVGDTKDWREPKGCGKNTNMKRQGGRRGGDACQKYSGDRTDGARMYTGCGKWEESGMMLRISAGVMGSKVDNPGWWVGQETLGHVPREAFPDRPPLTSV